MNKTVKAIIAAVLILVLGIGIYYSINAYYTNVRERATSEFFELITDSRGEDPGEIKDEEQIVKVYIDGYKAYGYTSVDAKDYSYWTNISSVYDYNAFDKFVEDYGGYLEEYNLSDPSATSVWSVVVYVLVVVVGLVLFWFMLRSMSGGGGKVMNFGKTKAKLSGNIKVRFSDVAGAEEEKEELKEIVEFLKNPHKFSELGARIPKGVLLVGPPGTGKTLFAKAVAGEAGVPFFSVSGSDFVEMYVGVGASRVRDLFDLAKRNQPCIIFIDEIDAVGRQRGTGLGGGHDEREQTLNQILVQMDGFESNEGVIVIAATNRADVLDDALLRPGRFDRQIHVHLPDVRGREAILKVHARNKPLAPDVNLRTVARITSGFSGADLANLLNEAAILAARAGKKLIGNLELYEGINKVVMGPQKKSRVVSEVDKKNTAYHESGHAVLAKLCKHCDEVQEVSIIPRGMAAGYTLQRSESDDRDDTVNKLNDMLCMILGGRAAEEIVIHDFSAGAANDIQKVTRIARKMVTEWGMSERLGPINYGSSGPVFLGRDYEERATYSEETAAIIDEEVKRIVSAAHERAIKLLTEHRSVLDNMARVLVERETIYTAEVDMLIRGATAEEALAYMEEHDKAVPDNPFGSMVTEESDGANTANATSENSNATASAPANSDSGAQTAAGAQSDAQSDEKAKDAKGEEPQANGETPESTTSQQNNGGEPEKRDSDSDDTPKE